jgi:hypothetical protein
LHAVRTVSDRLHGIVEFPLPPPGHEDRRTLLNEKPRDGQADATVGTGDDGNLALKPTHAICTPPD